MNKTLLVTGGARGIGRAITEYFLNKGWTVLVNYNKSEDMAKELSEKYENCFIFKADVSDATEVKKMAEEILNKFGFVDCVINNAGVALAGLFQDNTEDDFNLLFNTNVKGAFLVTKELIKPMIRNKKGTVINISSMWGVTGGSMEVLYSSTKAALIGLTKALAKEVGPSGIRVNAIAPGVIKTDMIKNISDDVLSSLYEETPLLRCGTPEEIAKTAYFLASDDSSFITGEVININGGMVI